MILARDLGAPSEKVPDGLRLKVDGYFSVSLNPNRPRTNGRDIGDVVAAGSRVDILLQRREAPAFAVTHIDNDPAVT